jgi:hypothetical protein
MHLVLIFLLGKASVVLFQVLAPSSGDPVLLGPAFKVLLQALSPSSRDPLLQAVAPR